MKIRLVNLDKRDEKETVIENTSNILVSEFYLTYYDKTKDKSESIELKHFYAEIDES